VDDGWKGRLTFNTPDMEEISRPKRPPPMQAKEPTMYYEGYERKLRESYRVHTGLEAILALYCKHSVSIFNDNDKDGVYLHGSGLPRG
jgi:hypothetical protein